LDVAPGAAYSERAMTTETFDDKDAFLAALHGKPRTTRGRETRPDIPAAPRATRTGLSTFIKAGWAWEFRTGAGYRLEKGALSTGWCASEKAACDAAKRLKS
jgi:hypothetical protein